MSSYIYTCNRFWELLNAVKLEMNIEKRWCSYIFFIFVWKKIKKSFEVIYFCCTFAIVLMPIAEECIKPKSVIRKSFLSFSNDRFGLNYDHSSRMMLFDCTSGLLWHCCHKPYTLVMKAAYREWCWGCLGLFWFS